MYDTDKLTGILVRQPIQDASPSNLMRPIPTTLMYLPTPDGQRLCN